MLSAEIYLNVAVKSIYQTYTYSIPPQFNFVQIGWRVLVPVKGRRMEGFVVSVSDDKSYPYPLKDIIDVLDEEPWFTSELIEVAEWLADFYLCAPGEIMRLFMPGKSGIKITPRFCPHPDTPTSPPTGDNLPAEIYFMLTVKRSMTLAEIKKSFADYDKTEIDKALAALRRKKIIVKAYDVTGKSKVKTEKIVTATKAAAEQFLTSGGKSEKRRRLLELVKDSPLSVKELSAVGITSAVIQAAAQNGLVQITERRVLRDSYREDTNGKTAPTYTPTDEQAAALAAIIPSIAVQQYKCFLLYGVTGSGKTFVYMEAAVQALALGRRVMVLVPEIALTGQVVESFKRRFGNTVAVIHSRLTLGERNDAIYRIRLHEADIIIGARSALFTPVDNLGLIIMDEEQDGSYKQDEAPRYHAKTVAQKLAEAYGAVLILASATPSLETYHAAKSGEISLLTLKHRVAGRPMPVTGVVDMREEMHLGNRRIISRALRELMEKTIAAHEQLIIMLNRRGFSTFIMCRSCGEVIKCPECTMPLTYHQNTRGDKWLLCHHCDITSDIPTVCPVCGSRYIKYFGSGTEKLEQELAASFPTAKILRMDRDTTVGKMAHQDILNSFKTGNYDILLGTQMVAKGHDIPNVTAVGILSADAGLNMPDFRAAERSFMLITQTAGRAGRGEKPGQVVVQCYNPQHYAVQCGLAQDYDAFYAKESTARRELFYPPFSRLVKLTFLHKDENEARRRAAEFVEKFTAYFIEDESQQILGPAPALMARLHNVYRFVALIKSGDLTLTRQFLRRENLHTDNDVLIDIDPIMTI